MIIECVIEDDRWVGLEVLADRAAFAALSGVGLEASGFEICLLACDDNRIRALNSDFRQKGMATNVLSWPSSERGADEDGVMPFQPQLPQDAELGDIAISYDTIARESAQAGTPFVDHVTHLIIHGTLHLLGFDHIRDEDGALMERLEIEILGELDIPDPYL
ncbi:MAG: rRNA maturation RNase YbeY [Octadecabacter sp.]|nr:rRNA maturation RNase YbeY [Octadecabacter sp.]